MAKNVKIVCGPEGCGKTTNAEIIRQSLGCEKVIDGMCPSTHSNVVFYSESCREYYDRFPDNTLVLTSMTIHDVLEFIDRIGHLGHGVEVLSFDDVMRDCKGAQSQTKDLLPILVRKGFIVLDDTHLGVSFLVNVSKICTIHPALSREAPAKTRIDLVGGPHNRIFVNQNLDEIIKLITNTSYFSED